MVFFFFLVSFSVARLSLLFTVFVWTTLQQQHAVWRPITLEASELSLEPAVQFCAVFCSWGWIIPAGWLCFCSGVDPSSCFFFSPPVSQYKYMLSSYYLVMNDMHFMRCSFLFNLCSYVTVYVFILWSADFAALLATIQEIALTDCHSSEVRTSGINEQPLSSGAG